ARKFVAFCKENWPKDPKNGYASYLERIQQLLELLDSSDPVMDQLLQWQSKERKIYHDNYLQWTFGRNRNREDILKDADYAFLRNDIFQVMKDCCFPLQTIRLALVSYQSFVLIPTIKDLRFVDNTPKIFSDDQNILKAYANLGSKFSQAIIDSFNSAINFN
ncbi:MAG: hypothetical protein JNL74_06545, partial [Fibrobacteres bacterium]|nr:hypothetical protein [Fibrobacterota bacterium]